MNAFRTLTIAIGMGLAIFDVAHAQSDGGTTYTTSSTTDSFIVRDVSVTRTVDDVSTTLTAILNGDQTVFSQTYALPFSDPAVQAGVASADAILAADKAAASAPYLSSTNTSQSSTVDRSAAVQTTIATGVSTVTASEALGPATIDIGPLMSVPFVIFAGDVDLNFNTDTQFYSDVTVTTTNTDLTTLKYIISGSLGSGLVGAAPEPSTWALMILGAGLVGAGLRRDRRLWAAVPKG